MQSEGTKFGSKEELTNEHHTDETLSAYIDRDLDPERVEEVDRHLHGCAECREVLDQLQAIRHAAGNLEQVEPSSATWYAVKRRVSSRPVRFWRWAGAGIAVAAAVLVSVLLRKPSPTAAKYSAVTASGALSSEAAEAGMASEYEEYARGIEEAMEECEAALAENPQSSRVRLAYLTIRSNRSAALDRTASWSGE